MIIDWFTVGAQALNFVVLVWLLKRFLYKPILDAIDAREKRISDELAKADATMQEALRERDEFRSRNRELDDQRAALLGQARDEAKAERQRLLDEARQAADALRARRQEALDRELLGLADEVTRRAGEEVLAIARKALADLATASLEERLAELFTRRLREMDGTGKEELAEALATASGPAVVRSAFELPEKQRAAIRQALDETFSPEVRVRFETAPEVIGGIELTAQGRRVAWSLAGYLDSLHASVAALVNGQLRPGADTGAAAGPPAASAGPDAPAETA